MIAMLPFELLAQITEDLSQQELLESMCSCRDWYYAFMPILYGRVILSKDPKQFRRFVEALEKAPDLRNLVHTIRWCAEVVTYANVNNIAQRCQNIGAMAITWNSRASISPLTVSLETFPILTRLTLEYHDSGLGPKTSEYGSTKLTAFLTSVPRLQALSLVNVIPLVRCIELNSIHKVCADLEHLDITCVHWDAKMTDIPGIGPFPRLRTLKITYERAGSQCTRFVSDYLQAHLVPRYPNLKKVEFQRSVSCATTLASSSPSSCPTTTSLQYQQNQQQHEKKKKQKQQQQKKIEQQPWLIWNDTTKKANFQGLRRALPQANGADNTCVTRILCSLFPRRSTYHLLLSTSILSFTGFLPTDQNMVELDILIDRFSSVDTFIFDTTYIKLSSSSSSSSRVTHCNNKNINKKFKGFTLASSPSIPSTMERLQALKFKNVQMDLSLFEYINRNCRQLSQVHFSVCKSHYKQQQSNNNNNITTTATARHVCEAVELKSISQFRTLCGNHPNIYFLAASWTVITATRASSSSPSAS